MSKHAFPPTSPYETLIDQLLQVYQTIVPEKSAIYVSTPMTSGKLYMQAFASLPESERDAGLSSDVRDSLFNQNCKHANSVAAMTRLHFPTSVVIDPTNISVEGWEQNDYLTFWRSVIIKYTNVVRFVDNWHYSNGCAYEFLVGVLTNKILIDEAENPIPVAEGCDLIQAAYNEHLAAGYDNEFLSSIVDSLTKYMSDDGA